MAWAKNGTPDTLVSGGLQISISDLTGKKFNVFLGHALSSGSIRASTVNINNVTTGNPYANRYNYNGGSDATEINQNKLIYTYETTSDQDVFMVTYGFGLSTEEKLFITFLCIQSATGAGTAPTRAETVSKWADTSNTINRVDNDSSSNNFDTGSNLSVLGTD